MRPPLRAVSFALLLAAPALAHADPLPVEDTTYIERSLNRYAPLTIEHPPVPRNPRGRRAARSAEIAGFCRDGGLIRRRDEIGVVIIRQREICDAIAPRTLAPGQIDPRPTWPSVTSVVVRTKG
ncbi:hypothetical protein [Methylobacterium nodulans]|uniref:PASTA domain-containing protein n=1 Tax=Methylobacterium nodulans (strain LMG 21967 / CNCM I-2342 / ORS 2060) TaxID=460265 RepID=B8IS16_METNO|nr:hypothetical protein [Methylobacterium nodulans]ACL56828.1 conserved hypothetical protein [Methylobacterium nodulans ORS 2060]